MFYGNLRLFAKYNSKGRPVRMLFHSKSNLTIFSMGCFKNVKLWLLPPSPSNFVVFSSIVTKFGVLKEYDRFFPKLANKFIWIMLLQSYEIIFCLRLNYSAEVIFLFSAFGIPNNRLDNHNLTLCDHNNLCGGESVSLEILEFPAQKVNYRGLIPNLKQY